MAWLRDLETDQPKGEGNGPAPLSEIDLFGRDRDGPRRRQSGRVRFIEQALELRIGEVAHLAGEDRIGALAEQQHGTGRQAHDLIGSEKIAARQMSGSAFRAGAEEGRLPAEVTPCEAVA